MSFNGAPVYLLSTTSFAFVVILVAQLVRARSLGLRELVICAGHIEAPRTPWTGERVRIDRSDVRKVQHTDVMGTRIVLITSSRDKLAISNRTVGEDGLAAALRWLGRS